MKRGMCIASRCRVKNELVQLVMYYNVLILGGNEDVWGMFGHDV
jgi:hypothetical protein